MQAFKREHNLSNNHEFQRYFNKRLQAIVSKHGKRMEGWDEILDPDLPKDIVIQSWQGQKSLVHAARQGYAGLLSAGYYLDLQNRRLSTIWWIRSTGNLGSSTPGEGGHSWAAKPASGAST